jgi:fructose-specific component phosphotransferase system IIB-like protein
MVDEKSKTPEGAANWHPKKKDDHGHTHEGDHMHDNEKMVIIEKGDRAAALKFLQERAGEVEMDQAELKMVCCMDDDIVHTDPKTGKKADFAHQNPGSFIHNFAIGQLTEAQIVKIAEKFDVFTSHEGCGAVGLVHAAVLKDPTVRSRFDAFLGKDLMDRVMSGESKDALGQAFSAKIAELAGAEYRHLPVERVEGHHSAGVAILDFANAFHGPNMEGAGAYVIDSTIDVLRDEFTLQAAVSEAVTYGPLAEVIAHGDHSHVPAEKIFTLLIVSDEEDADLGRKVEVEVQKVIAAQNLSERLQVMHFDKNEVVVATKN